ncbi:PilZ domain-containing protein [Thalassotalea piscium]|uniref:Type IV pilus assembly protein PilZ n=1 Tax=Thalassotalea piscium TaxID=1230533 RepID=A0A7X0NGX3_9GAMM|nr:PilZ domain-containing protein [Thalassotalea piscium]MBB6543217.1 type IV pilus assembly protein PilZ [Thalassotalea piscium]
MEIIQLEFVTERDLYLAYMPFLKKGGLFIRTTESIDLGTEIKLIVTLPDSLEESEVEGKVVWVTPLGSQNGTPSGIGISFVEDPENVRIQIEKSITRLLNSSEPSFTM